MGDASTNLFVRRPRTPIPQSRTPSPVLSNLFRFSPYQEGQGIYYPDWSLNASGRQFLTPSSPCPTKASGRKVTYLSFNICSQF
jgi:hypothetical protein